MNTTVLLNKLLRAARKDIPSGAVPCSFAGRVMANIRSCSVPDQWAMWSAALWRAAVPCAALALLLAAWTALLPEGSTRATEEFAQHFENTVLAGAVAEQSFE